jgi:hypothetical protein
MNPALRDLILGASSASTPSFSPTDISGLQLWLDASDASSVSVDGSNNVSEWRDKSGNVRHAVQATALLRPAYISAAKNGLNAIRNAASGALRVVTANQNATSFFGATRNEITIFVAWKYTGGTIGWFIGKATGGNGQFAQTSLVTSQWGGSTYAATAFSSSTSWRSMAIRYDGPNEKHDSWANGSKVATQTNFTGLAVAAGTDYQYRSNNDAAAADTDIGEYIVFNRPLSDSEVGQVNDYLNTKWALP